QPPRRSLGWKINATFLAFTLCALVSFLPQTWFFTPDWRTALTNDFGIALPATVTPQPWLTAGCFVSLVAGLCWLYRVSAQELELRVARFQLRLFASGVVATVALRLDPPTRAGTACRISLAVSSLLLLVSALLIAGGPTLDRFHLQKFAGSDFPSDFRWLIFQDTWQLIRSSPWVGLGLGNFESIFAIFRDASHGNTRSLHPESDWLWVWSELGWVAIPLIVLGAVLLIRRVAPLQVGTNQRFRLATLIGAVMFALHGLIDVSGHRVGTAYFAMFLLGLSLHRPTQLQLSKTIPWTFRLLGVALVMIGLSWTIAWRSMAMLPGAVGLDNAKQLAIIASRGLNFAEAINLTTRALNWAPLDWELYYLRATAEVGQHEPAQKALDDFRRARFLEPNSDSVPLQEGFVWLRVRPDLALVAWRE